MSDTKITDAELDAMEQRANAATPAPWEQHPSAKTSEIRMSFGGFEDDQARTGYSFWSYFRPRDAVFVAHARTDLPRLLAAYRALQAQYDGEVTGLCETLTVTRRERDALQAEVTRLRIEAEHWERVAAEAKNHLQTSGEIHKREEAAQETMRTIINYWYPRLGYSKANELSYPALGDRRATEAPKLAALARAVELLRKGDTVDYDFCNCSGECGDEAHAFIAEHGGGK